MTQTLSGKVALVTGGSRGIGAATARALASQGADVAISYTSDSSVTKAETLVRQLKEMGVRAIPFRADQANPVQVAGLIDQVVASFGRLDILVNNAGILPKGDARSLSAQQPPSLEKLLEMTSLILGFTGLFVCNRLSDPRMSAFWHENLSSLTPSSLADQMIEREDVGTWVAVVPGWGPELHQLFPEEEDQTRAIVVPFVLVACIGGRSPVQHPFMRTDVN
ncbi:SDR family NAD(P)-dependent oxidoreductase [Ktedonospora formicarum]|uniref:Ketoreductase domain-containing protein n=1 Tax=Ktedonospora formicarum TaxID=2778364 RepID=A0A8J3MY77_9CHLR|nr:SDR family NAD(P)-dependent oxidoreductase [Ktedonospora formicarum]GHO50503.1 hypothetical protein KSX_86660 [Ktedonospora formicarum]